jgi:cytochrome bd-type quinol oxidase subunit 2
LEYLISLSIIGFCCLCLYSYYVLKNETVTEQKYFHMAVTWGVVLTLFGIFSGIFVLIAIFSVVTNEWDNTFLLTKTPVFMGTYIAFVIFTKYKRRYKKGI